MKSLFISMVIALTLVPISHSEAVDGGTEMSVTAPQDTASQNAAPDQATVDSTKAVEAVGGVFPQSPERTPPSPIPEDAPQAEVAAALEATPVTGIKTKLNDEVWMISTREFCSPEAPLERLSFRHRGKDGKWIDETLSSFLDENSDHNPRRVVFYIHGNRTTVSKAEKRGLQTYERTFLGWNDAPAVRFVIWTWPSDQISGQIRDIRVKANRADQHCFYLARLLMEMENHREVSLIGHSYGGRLAVNTLHLLGGGAICGKRLATSKQSVPPINLTLIAPAIRNDCFVSSRAEALKQVNQMFLLYNSQDQLLKFYRYTKFDCQRPALGFTGIASRHRLWQYEDRIKQHNAIHSVGQQHDYLDYITDKRIEKLVQDNLFSLGAFRDESVPFHGPSKLNDSEAGANASEVKDGRLAPAL